MKIKPNELQYKNKFKTSCNKMYQSNQSTYSFVLWLCINNMILKCLFTGLEITNNTRMDEKHWLQKFEAVKNSTRKISIIIKTTTIQPLNPLDSEIVYVANGEILSSLSLVVLIICYGIVVFSGVCGNSTLLVSLCSSRLKNPLLLALCFADLLVSIISAPITIITLILKQNQTLPWSMRNSGCYAFHYMQVI